MEILITELNGFLDRSCTFHGVPQRCLCAIGPARQHQTVLTTHLAALHPGSDLTATMIANPSRRTPRLSRDS